jgi:aspartyl-tRNA(Asn)/glutamyl-tRNA(Gln) amidotransferase subunit C
MCLPYNGSKMAKLSREDVLKLARLARLHLSEQEVEKFQEEISTILGYVEQLQNVDFSKKKIMVRLPKTY